MFAENEVKFEHEVARCFRQLKFHQGTFFVEAGVKEVCGPVSRRKISGRAVQQAVLYCSGYRPGVATTRLAKLACKE